MKNDVWRSRLKVEPSEPRPIWSQVEDGMRRLLAAGTIVPGDSVPSVRDLATELRINPATVSRAYQRLVAAGLLEVRRGDGTYVSETPPVVRKSEQTRLLRQAAVTFASAAITHGADRQGALDAVREAYDELQPQQGGSR